MTFTTLGVASAIATGIIAPLTVWLVQGTFKSIKKANALNIKFVEHKKDTEAKLSDVRKDVDVLKESCKTSDTRLVRVEDAIVDIRAAVQRSDEQFTAIMVELKQLPRVMALMESFGQSIGLIVPRAEVESRIGAAEKRLSLVEQDIRGAKSIGNLH